MEFLFNSRGEHIANFVNDQLHLPTGENIGHYLKTENIFIDMGGKYLGEIVLGNRLLKRRGSPYGSTNFGIYGNYGNIGNYGNPGNHGNSGLMAGFEDIIMRTD